MSLQIYLMEVIAQTVQGANPPPPVSRFPWTPWGLGVRSERSLFFNPLRGTSVRLREEPQQQGRTAQPHRRRPPAGCPCPHRMWPPSVEDGPSVSPAVTSLPLSRGRSVILWNFPRCGAVHCCVLGHTSQRTAVCALRSRDEVTGGCPSCVLSHLPATRPHTQNLKTEGHYLPR